MKRQECQEIRQIKLSPKNRKIFSRFTRPHEEQDEMKINERNYQQEQTKYIRTTVKKNEGHKRKVKKRDRCWSDIDI